MDDVIVNLNSVIGCLNSNINKALERSAQLVENKAKENMSGHNRTGILRASITHTDPQAKTVTIGTNVEYAIPFHEGHGGFGGVQFLQDALDSSREEIIKQFQPILER